MKTVFWGIKGRRALAFRAIKELAATSNFFQEKPYTCVEMLLRVGKRDIRVARFSKAMWPDEWDPLLGEEIARKRALRALYRRVVGHREFDEILTTMLDALGWNINDIFTDLLPLAPEASVSSLSYAPGESSFLNVAEHNEPA